MARMLREITRDQRGYVMLVTLILLALIAVIGATSLSIAGVDHRISQHNKSYAVMFNTSHAGTEHGRNKLEAENPKAENLDSGGDSWGDWIPMSSGDTQFKGTSFDQNLGAYWVEAVYERCSNPPPGWSTEQGRASFRSDYWTMTSRARKVDTTLTDINEMQSTTVSTVRKVLRGACKIR